MEISAEKEIEYDHIIRLAFPSQDGGAALVPGLANEMKDTGDGEVSFKLAATAFADLALVRLRGVGLSYGTNYTNLETVSSKQYVRLRAKVHMPAQSLPNLDTPVPRPEIFLRSVGVFSPSDYRQYG